MYMPVPFTMPIPMFKLMVFFVGILAVIGVMEMIKAFITTITRACDKSYMYISTYGSSDEKYDNVTNVTNILKNNIDRSLSLLEKDDTLREFCNFEQIRSAVDYETQYINYAINQSIKNSWLAYVGFSVSDEIVRISKMISYMINHQLAMKECKLRYVYMKKDENIANFYVMSIEKYEGVTRNNKQITIYSLESISNGSKRHLIEYDEYFYNELMESSVDLEIIDTGIITGKIKKYIMVDHPDRQFLYEYLEMYMYRD
jgi:hypothetical protein